MIKFQVDLHSEFIHVTYDVKADNEEHAKQVAWERFQLDDVCWAKTPE